MPSSPRVWSVVIVPGGGTCRKAIDYWYDDERTMMERPVVHMLMRQTRKSVREIETRKRITVVYEQERSRVRGWTNAMSKSMGLLQSGRRWSRGVR